jgi:hypothetical protein
MEGKRLAGHDGPGVSYFAQFPAAAYFAAIFQGVYDD